jgi:hypothetical protein
MLVLTGGGGEIADACGRWGGNGDGDMRVIWGGCEGIDEVLVRSCPGGDM